MVSEGIEEKQVRRLVQLGFPVLLGTPNEQYLEEIPAVPLSQPDREFELLLLVDPRPSVEDQLQKVRGGADIDLALLQDRVQCPADPYWIWVNPGKENVGRKPLECLRAFKESQRGLTLIEGIHLIIQYPTLLNRHGLDLLGTVCKSNSIYPEAPYFYLVYGCPVLSQRAGNNVSRSVAIPFCTQAR
jgi:hypothetical protein